MKLFRREPKIEYVEVESIKTTEMTALICERAAGHFAMEVAKAKAAGRDERASAFEAARNYFLPQLIMEPGLDGETRFRRPSVGEKNWAEQLNAQD